MMSPLDRVPAAVLERQWNYVGAATGWWSRLVRGIPPPGGGAPGGGGPPERQRAWRALRQSHRALRRAERRYT